MRGVVVLVLVVPWLAAGCCVLDDACIAREGREPQAPAEEQVGPLITPGCDVDAVVTEGDVVCASCDFSGEDPGLSDICGVPQEAPCEVRQNNAGEACQLCVTAAGEILYDDCFGGNENVRVSSCESFAGATDDEVCTTCFDDAGVAVSTSCGPRSDRCEAVSIDGRACERCFAGDVVVSTTCEAVDLDPRVCRSYGNEAGRCVDCFDDAGAVLSHACTPASGPTVLACEETVQPEGIVCTVCVDENGTPVAHDCSGAVPEPERCSQLEYTEQTCFVCLGAADEVVYVDCVRNDCSVVETACRVDGDCPAGNSCFDGACVPSQGSDPPPGESSPSRCAAPPACTMEVAADGSVCRTCPRSDGVDETRCVNAPALRCEVVAEEALPDDPNDGGDADLVAPQGRTCVLCYDTASGVEVYRDCEGNGAVPPPFCVDEINEDGGVCSVCSDAVTGATVYTSCPDETCFGVEARTLVDADGTPLFVDGVEAHATCKRCGDAQAAAAAASFTASCAVDTVCTDPYGTDFLTCPETTTLLLAPRVCTNPWSAHLTATHGDGAGVVDELTAILAWSLTRELAVGAATVVVAAPSVALCGVDDCSCERGDRIELVVRVADVERAAQLFAPVLAP